MVAQEQVRDLMDTELIASDGEKLGGVKRVFLDDETGQPTWVTVNTGLFGRKENFVPLGDAAPSGGTLSVPYSKDQIKDSPTVDADDDHISPEEEERLYSYYGLTYSPWRGRETGREEVPAGEAVGTRETDASRRTYDTNDAMTRSEERLDVGTERQETGRARLRKYVVTEQEQRTVPVTREEVRVEREPVTDANVDRAMSGPELSEAEAEVTLHEERPVVEKVVEPVERVRLTKEQVTGEEQVSEPVRKERIETEGEGLEQR
jgi:uncharacterized protein (TIGR02271 family)